MQVQDSDLLGFSFQGISLPAAQSFLNYLALAVVYGTHLKLKNQPLRASWYKFAGLAAIDVTANFCLVEAYNFTSLTSVTLLDCWTVPSETLQSTLSLLCPHSVHVT